LWWFLILISVYLLTIMKATLFAGQRHISEKISSAAQDASTSGAHSITPPRGRWIASVAACSLLTNPPALLGGLLTYFAAVATSDVAPVIIGAAIGAGGAVLAQITASVFSGRRDTRRLRWEQETKRRDWEMHSAERFLDLKRELYSDYLAQANEFVSYINRINDPPGLPRPELPDIEKLHRIRANIELIAPREVSIKVDMAGIQLIGAVWALTPASARTDPDEGAKEAVEAKQALTAARRAMRADLGGEEDRYFGPAGHAGLEKVPPDPPPAHVLPWWRRAIQRTFRK
jgi:hypothetical protein